MPGRLGHPELEYLKYGWNSYSHLGIDLHLVVPQLEWGYHSLSQLGGSHYCDGFGCLAGGTDYWGYWLVG